MVCITFSDAFFTFRCKNTVLFLNGSALINKLSSNFSLFCHVTYVIPTSGSGSFPVDSPVPHSQGMQSTVGVSCTE